MSTPVDVVLALRHMVKAGASEQLLAAAARELAAKVQIAAEGTPSSFAERSAPPQTQSDKVTAAATGSLTKPVTASSGTPSLPPLPSSPPLSPGPSQEKVNFWDSSKKRSSVGILRADWNALLALTGMDESGLRAEIKRLAPTAPEGSNKSQWVVAQLKKQFTVS